MIPLHRRCNARHRQTFYDLVNVYVFDIESSVFMGNNYSDNLHDIKKTRENLISKKMFDISEKLIVEQSDEIFGVFQISYENSPWKQLSLVFLLPAGMMP